MKEGICKKKEFGNCGPIEAGNNYCLFHKPEKNEEVAREFYEKLKEQATIETDENGKEKLVFKDEVNWRGYVFPKGDEDSFFRGATFKSKAYFYRATFEEGACFWDATFEREANFWSATFEGVADFVIATFESEADFRRATFKGEAYFGDATFEGTTSFLGSFFKKVASFMGTLFERTCIFEGGKFDGVLFFTNTEFRQGVVMEEDWQNPEPGKYKLPQAEQEGCRVQKISHENEGRKEAAEAMFVREMRARRRERIRSEKKPLWKIPDRYIFYLLEKWAVDKTCKYGTDWYSLFKATLLVIVSFSLIYFLSYFNIGFLGNLGQSSFYSFNFQWSWVLFIELCHALLQSIIFSIVTFTTLGSGILNPEGLIISFLVGLQSLIGAFFVALFVVVFARKWMR